MSYPLSLHAMATYTFILFPLSYTHAHTRAHTHTFYILFSYKHIFSHTHFIYLLLSYTHTHTHIFSISLYRAKCDILEKGFVKNCLFMTMKNLFTPFLSRLELKAWNWFCLADTLHLSFVTKTFFCLLPSTHKLEILWTDKKKDKKTEIFLAK